MSDDVHQKIDPHTGTATTGHEWDGIAELNTPLPRWWLWSFYLTILWAIGYWVVYPAWPLVRGATEGALGWHSRSAIVEEVASLQSVRAPLMSKLASAPLDQIEKTPELLSFARAAGSAVFANRCAPCHGAGAQGAKGYPNLNDDDWLWGGKLADIQQTMTHGIRWDLDPKSRSSAMPAFGRDGMLKYDEISLLADYVRSLSHLSVDSKANLAKGAELFANNCAACHGPEGKGNQEFGAPNLTDQIWLYSSEKAAIVERITNGGGGAMPAWGDKLDPTTIKAVAVYVHALGGGQ